MFLGYRLGHHLVHRVTRVPTEKTQADLAYTMVHLNPCRVLRIQLRYLVYHLFSTLIFAVGTAKGSIVRE